jgi:hypothetical protein
VQLQSQEARFKRGVFLRTIFDDEDRGYICCAVLNQMSQTKFREEFFAWPEQQEDMLDWVDRNLLKGNLYFCPQLFKDQKRIKANVIVTRVAWADLDRCPPGNMLLPPSITVESSPNRFQAFWRFDKFVDPETAEDMSRRIAYKHAHQGADRSGWDLTQLLRMPLTYNFKYDDQAINAPEVKILDITRSRYRIAEFEDVYPASDDFKKHQFPFPEIDDLPPIAGIDILQLKRTQLNPRIWELFSETPEEGASWSEPLWQLFMLLFEVGYTREEVFAIAKDAACNKYERDNKAQGLLWRDVCRAWSKNEHNLKILTEGIRNDPDQSLLSEEERQRVVAQPPTFIERYQEWARSLGDAAPQYHQAGAFIALSSTLAGVVRLPTSFGPIIPNLWFLIAADTTLTRKSTAMDIAMDMIAEIDPNVVLATDGSIEGLLTSLSTRPGLPSLFLRDEFSGLLESMSKKDYYAGMAELLTKMYDNKMQKRVLRKETIEVRDPVLIIFAGGIKERIVQLLTFEQISSGFIPRFIFITAESDVSKLKPLGPPTGITVDAGTAIKEELTEIYNHYRTFVRMEISGTKNVIETPKKWDVELTPEAWIRYNKLEAQMLDTGLKTDRPDLMTPMYDRLSKSMLKAAILLGASRQRTEHVVITEDDILRAIMYGEQWRSHAREVVKGMGKGSFEKQMDAIMRQVTKNPGVSRSTVMQYHHLSARQANDVFETLSQRGLVTRQKSGRTEQLYPTQSLIVVEEGAKA